MSAGTTLAILTIPIVVPPDLNRLRWSVWGSFAGSIGGWLLGLGLVARWAPRPSATRVGHHLCLRISFVRRTAFATLLGGPVLAIALPNSWGLPGLALPLAIALTSFITTGEQWTFDEAAIRRDGILVPRREFAWSEIVDIDVRPPGMTLFLRTQPLVHLRGVMFDGYPEFVRTLIRQRPDLVSGAGVSEVLGPIADLASVDR